MFSLLALITSLILTSMNFNRSRQQDWFWVGGVQSTSASFRVRIPTTEGTIRTFAISTNSDLTFADDRVLEETLKYNEADGDYGVKSVYASSLETDTAYYFGSLDDSNNVVWNVGSFRTPAPEGTRMSFKVATSGCSLTGADSPFFDDIHKNHDPFLFINAGDFHYEDIMSTNIEDRVAAFDRVMGSASLGRLYSSQAMSYIWDDHDWIGNNQDGSDLEAGEAAKLGYQLLFPHYELAALSNTTAAQNKSSQPVNVAPYQAFTIGTVRFIILDLRSESKNSNETFEGSIYSTQQEEWLRAELDNSNNYDFVVMVSSRPWTGPASRGDDKWSGFANDRRNLSKWIASTVGAGKQNLLVVSSDNHMVAYDDGSSTDFSNQDVNPAGFPLIHSGPLANVGSFKGVFSTRESFFTDGCHTVNGELNYQYSILDFQISETNGAEPCVEISSYRDGNTLILSKKLCGKIMTVGTDEEDTCTSLSFTTTSTGLLITSGVFISLFMVLSFWKLESRCEAIFLTLLDIVFYFVTAGFVAAGAFAFQTKAVDTFSFSVIIFLQTFAVLVFLCCVLHKQKKE